MSEAGKGEQVGNQSLAGSSIFISQPQKATKGRHHHGVGYLLQLTRLQDAARKQGLPYRAKRQQKTHDLRTMGAGSASQQSWAGHPHICGGATL